MAGCGDVLSLEDLQTAKKHQIFEAEVITGKAGGVAGGANIGTATNPVTGQTQQTLPSILADLRFDVQSWTSSTGGVLASANQVFLNDTPGSLGLGDYYAWGGPFPKTVPAGTDPALSTSGYIMRSSRFAGTQAREALRRSYAEAGYNLVDGSFEAGGALVNANDVLLQERTGKAFSGPAGTVAAGTNPASGGFVDVSDKVNPVFPYVSELKATNAVVGCLYRTKGYYAAGDGGGAEYVAMPSWAPSPDGYGDHLAANGVVLQLVSQPTDLNHGVKVSGTFAASDAWNNRNALQAMLRNPRWSYFELVANGTYYTLGSVHPLRDNITILHRKGCNIRGRYNDTSIPASLTSQSGGMFGFVDYADPDTPPYPLTEQFLVL